MCIFLMSKFNDHVKGSVNNKEINPVPSEQSVASTYLLEKSYFQNLPQIVQEPCIHDLNLKIQMLD